MNDDQKDALNEGPESLRYESADSFREYIRKDGSMTFAESNRVEDYVMRRFAESQMERVCRQFYMGNDWWNPQYAPCDGCGGVWPVELLMQHHNPKIVDYRVCPICTEKGTAWREKPGNARSAGS